MSARTAVVLALVMACGACSPYLARRDTLSDASGEAVQANIAMHVVDPWPRQALRIDRETSGERAQRAIERYRNPQVGRDALGGAAQSTPAPASSGTSTGLR